MSAFYARPRFKWRVESGEPVTIDGKLQPEIGPDGSPVVASWTLAIGEGDLVSRLSSGVSLAWKKFRRKRDAEAFIQSFNGRATP